MPRVGAAAVSDVRATGPGTGPRTRVRVVADRAEDTGATGATGRVADRQITFGPIPDFGVEAEAAYRIRVKGSAPGDHRFRVRLACDQVKTPVVEEENT